MFLSRCQRTKTDPNFAVPPWGAVTKEFSAKRDGQLKLASDYPDFALFWRQTPMYYRLVLTLGPHAPAWVKWTAIVQLKELFWSVKRNERGWLLLGVGLPLSVLDIVLYLVLDRRTVTPLTPVFVHDLAMMRSLLKPIAQLAVPYCVCTPTPAQPDLPKKFPNK